MNRLKKLQLTVTTLLILIASFCWADDAYKAKVIGISDGDTIKVLHNGKQVRVRLYGIDTPEKRQAFGNKAKQYTARKVFQKTVLLIPKDTDRYGRTVAVVQIPGERSSLNEALVADGFAWVYRKYCKVGFCADWLNLEHEARSTGRGLWADPHRIPPWEYRKRK